MKELPKMYHNTIDKDINNNEKMYSTIYNNDRKISNNNIFINNKNNYTVEQKIYNIFNSPNYIYKIDVIIVTDKGKDMLDKECTRLTAQLADYHLIFGREEDEK